MDESSEFYPLNGTKAWHSMTPYRGWVRLGPRGRSFAVSMYHQLHCLDGIRSALVTVHEASNKASPEVVSIFGHVDHCFNFLRQNLLCSADTTLEHETTRSWPDGTIEKGTTSDGVPNRCRDWSHVHRWVKDNNDQWKGIPRYEIEEAKAAQAANEYQLGADSL